ncbi:MAG: nitrate reductase subunit alpha [Bdellovibrionales bacterium GWA2_49_15]|nr:MAG: nitrate reductase subunit alpha [Bdellovibrionales bacterium GWA2_49_15]
MGWIKDFFTPEKRQWEEFYRNRWQHDRVVRSTHGVNCTGGCSWAIYVKNGLVTWEMQQKDYPALDKELPPYEPRGCQRGISFSWYLYSSLRVKYPYVRGALLDLWRAAKSEHGDSLSAWSSIMNDPAKRRSFQEARGKGGLRRASWNEALEITAASTVHTIQKYGPDRIIGFSPIPAMSMLSYAAGARFLQLIGGVSMSFYDWYCDLPPASPEVWGEQTDVAESADWYNSKYIAIVGSNVSMTRTPDAHFLNEVRFNGAKVVVFSPDFSQVSKLADWWIPAHAGQDGAFWMAVNHVILTEYYFNKQTAYFTDYMKKYSDAPFMVKLEEHDGELVPAKFLRAAELPEFKGVENDEWKLLVVDEKTHKLRMPVGTLGFRWQKEKGKWNLEQKDADGAAFDPALTLLGTPDTSVAWVSIADHSTGKALKRPVPVRFLEINGKKVACTTAFDLMMAQFGVARPMTGVSAVSNYEDENAPYTPAWQEKYTGVDGKAVIQFAREWASTAESTQGRCSIIIGAGANHWYHNNLLYRSAITTLIITGCVGKNGGGLNHYVGQEKLAPQAPWASLAFALDWAKPARLQNTPSFHYVHSDQWRYEDNFLESMPKASKSKAYSYAHTMDAQVQAVRNGSLPFFPQFNDSSIKIVEDATKAGAKSEQEIISGVVKRLKEKSLRFAVEDPDAEANWPRLWFIWRGNALMSSAKGHEYFLKHYLGTHNNTIGKETAKGIPKEVVWHEKAPEGKIDLVVDLNFRMDTSALYSDIILPAATWYEKDDLNTTDMHSYIHPLSAAVPPCWESKSDWDIFKAIAKRVEELAQSHLPREVQDLVATPLQHDTPAEMAQAETKSWYHGECEAIPGKTMPGFKIVTRDYHNIHKRFISFGPVARKDGMGAHGLNWAIDDIYDDMLKTHPTSEWGGNKYPSIEHAVDGANLILNMAPETNGEVCFRAFEAEEHKTGVSLTDLCDQRGARLTFDDLKSQPRRLLNSPLWTGLVTKGRAYSAYCLNVERNVPWRTLSGRQSLYLDHPGYLAFGEQLPTYKPRPTQSEVADLVQTTETGESLVLNYLTPHGKWHIHSTYSDNHRMLTLSRGGSPIWINDQDALAINLIDNDWVEAHNDHGVVVARAVVSARIPRGICMLYHATERTIGVPKSPLRDNRRAGGHNSLNRVRLKPLLMVGGYAQFTYSFNYWGPTGVNRDTYIRIRKLKGEPQW